MSSQVGTTTMTSAQALTDSYVLADNALQAVYSTDKWLQLYEETQAVLEIRYTTGAAETSNYLEFYVEYGSGAPSLITWSPETVEYLDDSASQIILEPWTFRLDGASAGTTYVKQVALPVCSKGIRVYVKEVGVAANYGTVTIKANVHSAGAAFYNRTLQTVTLETSGITLSEDIVNVGGVAVPTAGADAVSNTRSDVPTSSRISVFNGTTWDRARSAVVTPTATMTGFQNELPWAVYNSSPTTRTNGQGGPLEATADGYLKSTEMQASAAEDNTNGVFAVARKFLATTTYQGTKVQSNSFTTTNAKTAAGTLVYAAVINTTASTRYIQFHNTATTPSGGATAQVKFLVPANSAIVLSADDLGANGAYFQTGIAYANSTVATTYTAGSAGDLLLDMYYI